jgi:hypothetical protein
VLVILNSGEKAAKASLDVAAEGIPDGIRFVDALDEAGPVFEVKQGKLEISKIWPHWGMILSS